MKMLIIGDQHLADRPPSSRKDTYRQDILDKLIWIIEYANSMKVDLILNLGDVFHIKRSDRNSHFLVQEVARIFGASEAPVLIVPGNHDLAAGYRLESIASQPLGTLALHPNINLLMGPSDQFPIYGIPFVEPTVENLEYWTKKYWDDGGPTEYPFIGTHQAIFPAAEEPVYEYVTAENWAHSFQNKYTAYGHIHSRMKIGAFYKIGGTIFCNNGAISRGSLHEETIKRKLAVTMFDDAKEDPFTSVPIPYKPAEEVFNLEAVEILKNTQNTVDAFLNSLGSSELHYLTVEGILDDARKTALLPKQAVVELEDIVAQVITEG